MKCSYASVPSGCPHWIDISLLNYTILHLILTPLSLFRNQSLLNSFIVNHYYRSTSTHDIRKTHFLSDRVNLENMKSATLVRKQASYFSAIRIAFLAKQII